MNTKIPPSLCLYLSFSLLFSLAFYLLALSCRLLALLLLRSSFFSTTSLSLYSHWRRKVFLLVCENKCSFRVKTRALETTQGQEMRQLWKERRKETSKNWKMNAICGSIFIGTHAFFFLFLFFFLFFFLSSFCLSFYFPPSIHFLVSRVSWDDFYTHSCDRNLRDELNM